MTTFHMAVYGMKMIEFGKNGIAILILLKKLNTEQSRLPFLNSIQSFFKHMASGDALDLTSNKYREKYFDAKPYRMIRIVFLIEKQHSL